MPGAWAERVHRVETEAELDTARRPVEKGQPHGGKEWPAATAKRLGLKYTFRQRGQPRKG
jgi:hypothetical protein